MSSRWTRCPRRPVAWTLLAWLALTAEISAQGGPHRPGPGANQPAVQQMNLKEAEVLREAYMVLAAANHDYDGHRALAMKQIKQAVGRLDEKVLKNGTAQQKATTLQEDAVAARSEVIAKYAPTIHEPQALSDALLRKGAQLLATVAPVVRQRGQKAVLEHITNAEKEIVIALKIR